jgi:hypothetical protein
VPTYVLPYRNAFGNGFRPYLGLHVTGPNGQSGPIVGLVDSGADKTSLPAGFATLMGYTGQDLEPDTMGVADGTTTPVWNAKKPASAYVVGLPDPVFELYPTFVQGNNVTPLWGRADFFQIFTVGFDEPNQRLTLSILDLQPPP